MPIEITGAHPPEYRLRAGDVIMVHRKLKDKETKEPFWWKYFAVIIEVRNRHQNLVTHMILDEKYREPMVLYMRDFTGDTEDPDPRLKLWYLPESEWPDGVYAFRTKLILEGRIDLDF
jgi:hypothetical protein